MEGEKGTLFLFPVEAHRRAGTLPAMGLSPEMRRDPTSSGHPDHGRAAGRSTVSIIGNGSDPIRVTLIYRPAVLSCWR